MDSVIDLFRLGGPFMPLVFVASLAMVPPVFLLLVLSIVARLAHWPSWAVRLAVIGVGLGCLLPLLLGLVGTGYGLVQAFSVVENADPSMKQEMLTAGISLAMYTTWFGAGCTCALLLPTVASNFVYRPRHEHSPVPDDASSERSEARNEGSATH